MTFSFLRIYSILILTTLSGCYTPGLFIDLKTGAMDIENNHKNIILLVQAYDNRKEVVEKSPSYIGYLFVGHFNKFDVNVKDSMALGICVSKAIQEKLFRKNIPIDNFRRNRPARIEIENNLRGKGIRKLIFVEINDFKAETIVHVDVSWNMKLWVEDLSGAKLYEKVEKGEIEENANLMKPGKTSENIIPKIFNQCIDSLVGEDLLKVLRE
jgi:hypothetical protein